MELKLKYLTIVLIRNMEEKFKEVDILDTMVKAIVLLPEQVEIIRTVDDRGVLLTLKVNPSDRKFVIGKEGSMAGALRYILKAIGSRLNANVSMVIHEPVEEREVWNRTHPRTIKTDLAANLPIEY